MKRYRGKGKSGKENTVKILLTNMRGFKSKKESLERILSEVKPSVVVINETLMKGNAKIDLPPYSVWSKNRGEKGGGGIATAVAPKYKDTTVGAGEGEDEDEYIITRMESFKPALNIINCYGEQRSTKIEEIEKKWSRLSKEMETIRARGEFCLLAGDLNKLVGNDDLGVPGNHQEISAGGRLLRNLLQTGNWTLVNGMGKDIVEGGPFTREDPATGILSCLDLFVVSKELRPFVAKLVIDREKKMTVARATKRKESTKLTFSDHYSAVISLVNLPRSKAEKNEKQSKWNLAKVGGWMKYKEESSKYCKALENVIEDVNANIDEKYEKFKKIHNKIKFKAFGKVTIGTKKESKTKSRTDGEDLAKELLEAQQNRADAEINEIERTKGGKVGKVWEIKKKVIGGKKAAIEATTIINPKSGKLALTKNEIKKVTLQYTKDTLASNPAKEEFAEEIERKRGEMIRMLKENNGNFDVANKEIFEKVLSKFKSSRKRNYDFIVKADESFQEKVFQLCQIMMENEKFPAEFRNTTLHMIYKGKGKREDLTKNRFIHSKSWFPRLVEGLVVEGGLKKPLVEKSSIFQIGGQPGHRAEELLFVMKSVIARQRMQGKEIVLQCYDISKYFDKEMMHDAILACKERGADPKAIRLWYKLNEETEICVKTGVGTTEPANVGAVVGQGTMGGALVSQAVLDEGTKKHFEPGNEDELMYGRVPMAPCLFQDDIIHGAKDLEKARLASNKVATMMAEKNLKLNEDKCVVIAMGTKKQREKVKVEMQENPIRCGDFKMKTAEKEKWLGQQLSAGGLADSVAETVDAKEGKIKAACLEIANIVNDWRTEVIGGFETAIILWEACVIPSLLHSSSTWTQISKTTENKLNNLQRWFVRLIMQVPQGTPSASLTWETGLMDMRLRIWREKLMLILHIRSLGEETLAQKVYNEQKKEGWPGLAKETKEICEELGIVDCNTTHLSKSEYKELVNDALKMKDEEFLRKEAEGKRKCGKIMEESYGKKGYIAKGKINEVRNIFKARVGMTEFADNFSKDKRFMRTNWLCRCGKKRESEDHITKECPIYDDIRSEYEDLYDDIQLASFFSKVLERRDLVDDLEEGEQENDTMVAGATDVTARLGPVPIRANHVVPTI